MKESIPEVEALKLLIKQCREVVSAQGQNAFQKVDAVEARRQADRLDLLERAEAFLADFQKILTVFPEVFATPAEADTAQETGFVREVKNESIIQPEVLRQRVVIQSDFANASGYWDGERFTIEKESQMRITETPSIPPKVRGHREMLKASGVVVRRGEHYVFTRQFETTSLSTAAGIILGKSSNGRQEWKLANGSPIGTLTPKKKGGKK